MTRLRARTVLPVLLAALALGASACSGDEPGTGPSPAPGTSSDAPSDGGSDPTPDLAPAETITPDLSAGPSEQDGSPGPTTYDDAAARLAALAGAQPQDLDRFETADGLYCLLSSDLVVGCELPSGGIPDPDYCGDAPTENIGRIELDLVEGTPPVPVCNSDTIREPDAPVVEVGSLVTSSTSGLECAVEDIGVTCLDPASRQGFFLAPDSYTVFGA